MKSQILIQTSIGKKDSSTWIEGSGDELAIFYAKLSLQNRLEYLEQTKFQLSKDQDFFSRNLKSTDHVSWSYSFNEI